MVEARSTVIIGAGIAGMSLAFSLAKKIDPKSITVIDREGSIDSVMKASAVNCGIVCSPDFLEGELERVMYGYSF